MTQEPKSQQQNMENIYELVTINHTILSALASISTFIQNHPTTEASNSFSLATKNIDANLELCIAILKDEGALELATKDKVLSGFLENVETRTLLSMKETPAELAEQTVAGNINEAYIIIEQLKWLYSLSKQMLVLVKKLDARE